MMEDPDTTVITNVVVVLNELLLTKGGIEITHGTLMHLLNRIGEFNEWGLTTVLDLVSRYKPVSEDETYAIMNLLDPVFRTANSGAVLATLKSFLNLTSRFPDLHPQIINRAKPPLLTLITGSSFEVQYTMLKHLKCILPQPFAKGIFEDEYRQFFVKYGEPSYIKYLKIDLIPLLANFSNATFIISELVEYVTDVDAELSKRAIDAMGEIARRIPTAADQITRVLLELVDLDMPYVRSRAVRNFEKVLHAHHGAKDLVLPVLPKCLRKVEDAEAKSKIIWIIGEFGEHFPEAPYLLEILIGSYNEEESVLIKQSLLSATIKLFFKRAPETHLMLGRLLLKAVDDTSNQDIHDKALLYYRLLSTDVQISSSLFNTKPKVTDADVENFAEDSTLKTHETVFGEFNSLAIVYSTPSTLFVKEEFQWVRRIPSFHFPNESVHRNVSMNPIPILEYPLT
jgi:AP-4 complex subunit beta-1